MAGCDRAENGTGHSTRSPHDVALLLGGAQVVLRVEMPCSGCSDAVKRVLGKMPGTPSKCWAMPAHAQRRSALATPIQS